MINRNRKLYIFLIILAVITIPFAKISYDRYKSEQAIVKNEQKLAEKISELPKDTPISLKDITPFEWDEIYFLDPYAAPKIAEKEGIKWNGIEIQTTGSAMQILFLKDKNVVCYCCGTGESNGYYFDFHTFDAENGYFKFSKNDNLIFEYDNELSERYGYNYLIHKE